MKLTADQKDVIHDALCGEYDWLMREIESLCNINEFADEYVAFLRNARLIGEVLTLIRPDEPVVIMKLVVDNTNNKKDTT